MAVSAITLGYWGQKFSHTQLSLWGSLGMAEALIGLSLATKSLILAFAMTALLGHFCRFSRGSHANCPTGRYTPKCAVKSLV